MEPGWLTLVSPRAALGQRPGGVNEGADPRAAWARLPGEAVRGPSRPKSRVSVDKATWLFLGLGTGCTEECCLGRHVP